jgi:endo-1,4-beta-xylanase
MSHETTRFRRPRWTIGVAAAAAALAATSMLVLRPATPADAATSLRALAEARGRYFGTALTQSDLSISGEMSVATAQFDMVTPGNEMKWDTTQPSASTFNFGPGDRILSFGQTNGMRVRGHNLVWHSQLPSWVTSLPTSQVQAAMNNHITTEVTHYKGKIYAWDVINEPFEENGTLRQDVFYQAMGTDYLATALRTAHAADPAAKLYINDYNIEGVNAKSDGLYNLAKTMLQQGVPLNGIGLESHFIVGQVPSTMLTNMQRFADLGLDVAITELDDRIPTPASSANLQQQGTDYGTIVRNCLAVSHCPGISQWGVDDGHSWIPGTFPGYGAAMMYDANYQPKPAYNATVAALSAVPSSAPGSTGPSSASSSPVRPSSASPSSTGPTPTTGCAVSYTMSTWNTGFTADITIVNRGTTAINGWNLAFPLPSGQTITSGWNATYAPTSGTVTATNVSYNATIAPGASVSIGFQATHTGDTGKPSSFTLNGAACTTT